MKNIINKSWMAILVLFVFILVSGCTDKKKESTAPVVSGSPASTVAPAVVANSADASDIAVSVDGTIMKKAELESKIKERIKILKNKIPADKQKEARESIKKQLTEEFIVRTLLINEMAKKKIEVGDKEIKMMEDKIKAALPPNKTIEQVLKENNISKDAIVFEAKVEKFANMEIGNKAKPTQKEISKFYKENSDKFVAPESAHVRHVLVAVNKNDNDKVKAEKKAKIEKVHQQLLKGDDFAEVARKNSDCPSKEVGGDLNFIKRGQTVKTFEDAAFSQGNNVIGPVITTEYGYHVIQVLERKPAKTVALNEVKEKISAYLDQQNKTKAFGAIMKKLQESAKIIIN